MGIETRRGRPGANEENLVPLINIVFLILIFFLVTSTLRPYSDREIELAHSEALVTAGAVRRAILLARDGTLKVDNSTIALDQLGETLAQWAEEPARTVTIIADRRAAAEPLVAVVTMASAAGLTDIKLLTRRTRSS
ncbi:MAG: hypothetical protein GC150_09700 [Rhizobiales bacterium]|nr:hypothetical protein [Hyphomicrobiales bacterium]